MASSTSPKRKGKAEMEQVNTPHRISDFLVVQK